MEPKSFCCRQEAILHSVFVLFNENTATQSQQHQIWTLHVINNKQEQHNLFHLLPRHYSVLLVENIYCLSSPDACVFYQTACISSQQEAAQSQRSSLTLWSADHALFWFPFDLTVWVHRFPPQKQTLPACAVHWYFQTVIHSRWWAESSKCNRSCHFSIK